MDAHRDIAAARSRSYWLLSRLFLEQPDMDLLRELAAVLAAAGEQERGGPADALEASALAALNSQHALTELQVEYTRLLGGASRTSGAPQPYESVAREGRLFGASAEAVAAAYVAAGHQDLVSVTGPPDHVGTELRFLALLCYEEMQAWVAHDQAPAVALLERELSFLEEHVLPWVPALCDAIQTVAAHPFYRAAARLTADACTSDCNEITSLLRSEPSAYI
jgi:putative dimethyl sulfoxide reductase chaperone